VFYLPDALGDPDNYIPANAVVTPTEIKPEWYLRPFYAILRAIDFNIGPIDSKLGGVIAMFASIGVLFVLPWLDTSKVRSMRYRPVARVFFLLFVVACLALGYCGGQPPDKELIHISDYRREITYVDASGANQTAVVAARTADVADKLAQNKVNELGKAAKTVKSYPATHFIITNLAQVMTAYYFLFFLVILPLLGLRERPNQVPETIAKSVLGHEPEKVGA
jgi:ubiquinol-cytochrome c reductase cytochrome b subunit